MVDEQRTLVLPYYWQTVDQCTFITSPPLDGLSIAISVSVCLSVRLHISKTRPDFLYMLPMAVTRFLLWRQCNMLCISSFVDDVMFSHNGPNGPTSKMTQTFRTARQMAPPEAKLLSVIAGLFVCAELLNWRNPQWRENSKRQQRKASRPWKLDIISGECFLTTAVISDWTYTEEHASRPYHVENTGSQCLKCKERSWKASFCLHLKLMETNSKCTPLSVSYTHLTLPTILRV